MRNSLLSEIKEMPVIDVHEHILSDSLRCERFQDYISLLYSNYTYVNAVSAGIELDEVDYIMTGNDLEKKYKILCKTEPLISNTSLFQVIERGFSELYGISIRGEEYQEINKRYCEMNKPGWTRNIVTKKTKIEWMISDVYHPEHQNTDYAVDSLFVRPSIRCDKWLLPHIYMKSISKELNRKFSSLQDWIDALDEWIRSIIQNQQAISLKIGSAYDRTLHFQEVTYEKAARAFMNIQSEKQFPAEDIKEEQLLVGNYVMYHLSALAAEMDVPIQIHTGFQDRNQGYPTWTDPDLLLPLFNAFKRTKFVILHTAFPDAMKAAVLTRMFPNVYVDFSWVNAISPTYSKNMLLQYLEVLPVNKISFFGGDFFHIEGAYGHLLQSQETLASVGENLIKEGRYTEKEVLNLCQKLLYEAPKHLYKL